MFEIVFYESSEGKSELKSFIEQLSKRSKTVKDARIAFTKIVAYLNLLQEKGTTVGMPVLRHLQDEIWELRPLAYRILFAKVEPNMFVLLHHFRKTTKRTPIRELEKAIHELVIFRERNANDNMD